MGEGEVGRDELGSRRSGTTPAYVGVNIRVLVT